MGEYGAGAAFPLSSYQIQQLLTAYMMTPHLPSSVWMPKRPEGLPGTPLHLSTSILQGLPLHPLCIKVVNQKGVSLRKINLKTTFSKYIYIYGLSDWLSFCLYSLNYSHLLTLDIFFLLHLRSLGPSGR